ncbi:hypothetical protein [Streptomyces sp. S.PNR 29]|uniref:hypothetical protein n=1 Tax=Streptomyces sp. S.PNR 29 TaxID=2973805 RepID=UPI0025B0DA8A|nr:hypothetical protein [Streptomyces sp. S.PNR 29]MDN0198270.1 hypothetical protein [Streptomyces sp. S.PNR 29]
MCKRLLRSVLAAALSAVAVFGALSGYSDAKGDTRADSHWPSIVANDAKGDVLADSHWPSVVVDAER